MTNKKWVIRPNLIPNPIQSNTNSKLSRSNFDRLLDHPPETFAGFGQAGHSDIHTT